MNLRSLLTITLLSFSGALLASPSPFMDTLHNEVTATFSSENKLEEDGTLYLPLREKVVANWQLLVDTGIIRFMAPDSTTRPHLVALQSLVESIITRELGQELKSATAILHAPMPATPLCHDLIYCILWLDPRIQKDPLRRFTAEERINGLRSYMQNGGIIYSVYPKSGFHQRSENEQQIYLDVVEQYPDNLVDFPLNDVFLDRFHTGATYVLTDRYDNKIVFSIELTQSNNPMKPGIFKIWLGDYENQHVQKRVAIIKHFIKDFAERQLPEHLENL